MAAVARGMATAAVSILGICRALDEPRQGLTFGENGFTPAAQGASVNGPVDHPHEPALTGKDPIPRTRRRFIAFVLARVSGY